MRKIYTLIFLLTFFVSSCNRSPYQLIKSKDGIIYRLNKKTGEIAIIENNNIISVEEAELKDIKKSDMGFVKENLPKSQKVLINKIRFDLTYRVAKEIEGAIKIGVAYKDFAKLVRKFSTEVKIAKDKIVTEEEQELLTQYENALSCYEDSLTLWKAIIYHHVDNSWRTQPADEDLLRSLKPMLSKYGIEIQEGYSKVSKRYHPILPKSSIEKIWIGAEKRVHKANKILKR